MQRKKTLRETSKEEARNALKFDKKDGMFLEDDGEGLPLNNSSYTMEFWVWFGSEHAELFVWTGVGVRSWQTFGRLVFGGTDAEFSNRSRELEKLSLRSTRLSNDFVLCQNQKLESRTSKVV